MKTETKKRMIARGMVQRIAKLKRKVDDGSATSEESARYFAIRALLKSLYAE